MDRYFKLLDLFWIENKITVNKPDIKILPENSPVSDTFAAYLKGDEQKDWKDVKTKHGIQKQCSLIPKCIHIRLYCDRKRLPDALVVPTFLHEIAHTITPVIAKKVGKKWEYDYHGPDFYKNYAKILRWAEKSKLYKLTYQHKKQSKFSYNNLLNFDKIYLINQSVSTGQMLEKWNILI
jgi:hypothetical protein